MNTTCVLVFLLQEWAEELFNLASNLLVQNISREACLEKGYVIQKHTCTTHSTHAHADTQKAQFQMNINGW